MSIHRAVAGLLLLALVLGCVQAGNRCANCGLGEGTDACTCGNTAVRAKKLTKPAFFASPEAIKNAVKLKKAYSDSIPLYIEAIPAPTPVNHRKDKDTLKNLLRPTSGIPIAPKFEPIGDLCHSCKGYKNDVVGVVPARPGKLPCKCPKSEDKSTSTAAPLPTYSASGPAYSAPTPSYSVPAPSYSYSATSAQYSAATPSQSLVAASYPYSAPAAQYTAASSSQSLAAASYGTPASSHSNPAPLYSGPTAAAQYAPAYQTHALAFYPSPLGILAPDQYVSAAYPQPYPTFYARAASFSPAKRSYKESESHPDYKYNSKQNAITTATPTFAQYAAAHQEQASIIHEVEPPESAKRSYKKSNPQLDYGASPTKRSYQQFNQQNTAIVPATYAVPSHYDPAYQGPAPVNYLAAPSPPAKAPCYKSNAQSDKDEREAETYVEIVLQKEQTPTADPVSISLAYKNLAESHGKQYVAEDSLAYGHYKEPEDGRVCKHISNFDEEKLHTLDKPVVELKDCECRNGNCRNIQVFYSDIGYGPVAPSKNRFVPKTDDASNSPYTEPIIYVQPPEDQDSLSCGPLGPTIPGYKSGGVIVNNHSKAKSSCGCAGKSSTIKEGSRQGVLIEEDEYDSDSYDGKGGIIERIKSSACKSGY